MLRRRTVPTQLSLTTWLLVLFFIHPTKPNLVVLVLMRHLAVCYRTAWRFKHKSMQAMQTREAIRHPTRFGSATSPISPPMRAGYSWPW